MGSSWSLRARGSTEHATSSGQAYRWYYKPRSRNSPARSELSIAASLPVEFRIAQETWFHRAAKWLGFASEFQTGDADFDGNYYIYSDDEPFCALLRGSDLRRSLSVIFARGGGREVRARSGDLTVTMKTATDVPSPARADDIVPELLAIQERVGGVSAGDRGRRLAARATAAIWLISGLSIAALVAWLFLPYRLLGYAAIVEATERHALLPIACSLLLIWTLFKGSSRGVTVFGTFLAVGVAGAALATYDALYAINIHLDGSEPTIAVQNIDGTVTQGRRGSTHYFILTPNPSQPEQTLRLPCSRSLYDRVHRGDLIRIKTHPGYLSYPWIEDFEVKIRAVERVPSVAAIYA